MAQFRFGAFRSCSPGVGVAARRSCRYWRGARISTISRSLRISFSRLNRINSSKFRYDQRPVTVSGGKAACDARRPELEALGGKDCAKRTFGTSTRPRLALCLRRAVAVGASAIIIGIRQPPDVLAPVAGCVNRAGAVRDAAFAAW